MSKHKAKHRVAIERVSQGKPLHTKGWSLHQHGLVLLISLFLIVATLAVFWQVRNHEFINLDDNVYITDNRPIQDGLRLEGVIWTFTTIHAGHWHPLTWLSHMLDCELYGLNPGGHHLTNLAFHIANTLLLFLVLKQMTGRVWISGFVAALFALHPLRVESVAWVAERKDVLSTFFWVLTIWAYVRYVERPRLHRYLLVLLCFALGLSSKPMFVTLPFILLLLDYWPLSRFQFGQATVSDEPHRSMDTRDQKTSSLHLVEEKAPLFLLSAVLSIITVFAQQKGGAVGSLESYSLQSRIANALISYVSYIEKMIWPHHLAVFYPYPEAFPIWKVVGSGLLLIGVSVLVIRAARKLPSLAVGWFWYLGTLVPVIGLVQVGMQAMADRFTYIPLIGLFIMISYSIPNLPAGWSTRKIILCLFAGLLILILMILTTLQVKHWQNDITLFEHSLKVTANNYLSHNNLGVALYRQGKNQGAIGHFTEALKIKPDYGEAHNNLGAALERQGATRKALDHYAEALRIKPDNAKVLNNLGTFFLRQGESQEAMVHFTEALRIEPDYAEVHYNLGALLLRQGKSQEAVVHFTEALRNKRDYVEAHNSLGIVLERLGRIQEAIGHYTEALRIKPDSPEVHNNLGVLFFHLGKNQEAIAHFAKALRLKPDYAEAHVNMGLAYLMIGNKGLALEEYKILKKLNPDLADHLYQKISK
jgi:tetratricopeptide (TPR) repeat protein